MSEHTFVSAVLAGDALLRDVDDWIDSWHDSDSPNELHEFLGMSWEEYRLWAEQPASLRFILAAHKNDLDVDAVQEVASLAAAAARSTNEPEAVQVIEWLRKTGRLPVE